MKLVKFKCTGAEWHNGTGMDKRRDPITIAVNPAFVSGVWPGAESGTTIVEQNCGEASFYIRGNFDDVVAALNQALEGGE